MAASIAILGLVINSGLVQASPRPAANAAAQAGAFVLISGSNARIQPSANFTQSAGPVTVRRVMANQGSFLLADGSGGFSNFTNATGGNLLVINSVLNVSGTLHQLGVVTIAGGTTNSPINVTHGTAGVLTSTPVGSVLWTNAINPAGTVIHLEVVNTFTNQGVTKAGNGTVPHLTGGLANNAGLLAAMGAGAQLNAGQSFTNIGSISIGKGTLTAALNNARGVTNAAGGLQTALNASSLAFNNALQNSGAVNVQDQSTTPSAGAVTPTGTFTVQNRSVLTFNSSLTHNGRVITFGPVVNPSTAVVSGSLILGSGGIISMSNPSKNTPLVASNFVNGSTNNNSFDMRKGTLVPGAAGGLTTNTFAVAGKHTGTNFASFNNNFTVNTVNMTNDVRFVGYINGGGSNSTEALYVDVLHLFKDTTMKLSTLTVYVGPEFVNEDTNGTKTINAGIINPKNAGRPGVLNTLTDADGQLVLAPEASTWVLLGMGLAALVFRTRWRRRGLKHPLRAN